MKHSANEIQADKYQIQTESKHSTNEIMTE